MPQPREQLGAVEAALVAVIRLGGCEPLKEQARFVYLLVGEQSAEKRLRVLPDGMRRRKVACAQGIGGVFADPFHRAGAPDAAAEQQREKHERRRQPPHTIPSFV